MHQSCPRAAWRRLIYANKSPKPVDLNQCYLRGRVLQHSAPPVPLLSPPGRALCPEEPHQRLERPRLRKHRSLVIAVVLNQVSERQGTKLLRFLQGDPLLAADEFHQGRDRAREGGNRDAVVRVVDRQVSERT